MNKKFVYQVGNNIKFKIFGWHFFEFYVICVNEQEVCVSSW